MAMSKKPAKEKKPGKPSTKTTIQSVARASRMLLLVAEAEDRVTAKAVADALGLSLQTAYHLLSTLVDEGLLSKERGRQYRLGPKATIIADAVARDQSAPERYVRALRELAESTGETAYLSAWRGGEIQVLTTVEGAHAVRVAGIATGVVGSEYARASGKLLMAHARAELRDPLISGKLTKLTPHTITKRRELEKEFEEILREGYSVDREEYSVGVTCLSAPITEGGKTNYAYTVSVPTARYHENESELRKSVLAAAAKAAGAA